jgi:hypothetical protein
MNGKQMPWVCWVSLDLWSKTLDGLIDGARLDRGGIVPHLLEESFARNRRAGTRGEVLEQADLGRCEAILSLLPASDTGMQVYNTVIES